MNCNKCKNPIDSSSIHCEWCGTKVNRETANSNLGEIGSYQEFLDSLNKLDKLIVGSGTVYGAMKNILFKSKFDSVKNKADYIKNYPLSNNNLEAVLQIANLSTTSIQEIESNGSASETEEEQNKMIKRAWETKLKNSLSVLDTYGKDEFIRKEVKKIRDELAKREDKKRAKRKVNFFIFGFFVIIIIGVISFFVSRNNRIGSENQEIDKRLELLEDSVNIYINQKNEKQAELLVLKLNHPANEDSPHIEATDTTIGNTFYTVKYYSFNDYWKKKKEEYLIQLNIPNAKTLEVECDQLQIELEAAKGKLEDIKEFEFGRTKEGKRRQIAKQKLVVEKLKNDLNNCN